ncbi:hypothetical protein [Allorhizocola rhizosphaerae]|uniref:hypothetical protein n=1 Tax=Allorhizocola rhizosphaerae TaxID=1872709 RepID=UPI000E3DBA18|nr:hypothetical protein [Allorhizocola rhizosphaerae]
MRSTSLTQRVAVSLLVILTGVTMPAQAAAKPAGKAPDTEIVLPGATSAEGIAKGHGDTFYAGDLFTGDIFKGNVEDETAELFIDVPEGRMAGGMTFDPRHDLLFVAGGFSGEAYVYDTKTKATVATYQLADPADTIINDAIWTREGVWFTDSRQPRLYFVPVDGYGELGQFRTLELSGPAADTSKEFNNNGIEVTECGSTLIVAHTGNGELYTVDPVTGTSALIAGISVPNVDGIVLDGRRLWAVQNFSNQVTRIKLADDLSSGEVRKVITSELFQVPSTAALFGDTLAVVNAKFDTGLPPTADEYEVVLVRA